MLTMVQVAILLGVVSFLCVFFVVSLWWMVVSFGCLCRGGKSAYGFGISLLSERQLPGAFVRQNREVMS
jgi:hypothetical protein